MLRYYLDAPTREEFQRARKWRLETRYGLRTPYIVAPEQQDRMYDRLTSDPAPRARYWAVRQDDGSCVAIAGLIPIQWENKLAEIALLTDPGLTQQGVGTTSVDLVLEEAFDHMGLATVVAECYECNDATHFWRKMAARHDSCVPTKLPRRKFWEGKLWDSLYITWTNEGWRKAKRERSA
jgi:RimJ/RimL family protein N-acetyltransferase